MLTPHTTKVKVRARSDQMLFRLLKIWMKLRKPTKAGGEPLVSE